MELPIELSDDCHCDISVPVEIVKWGFWRKLPLLPLLWHADAIDEISNFPIYCFTNDLLSQFINFGIMKSPNCMP